MAHVDNTFWHTSLQVLTQAIAHAARCYQSQPVTTMEQGGRYFVTLRTYCDNDRNALCETSDIVHSGMNAHGMKCCKYPKLIQHSEQLNGTLLDLYNCDTDKSSCWRVRRVSRNSDGSYALSLTTGEAKLLTEQQVLDIACTGYCNYSDSEDLRYTPSICTTTENNI